MTANSQTKALPVRPKETTAGDTGIDLVIFGKELRDSQFLLDPSYRNLNNGSFGTIPRAIQTRLRTYQSLSEAQPDPFIRYTYPTLLDVSRAAIADLLRVPVSTCVFVSNATLGVNTVLRNLVWSSEGTDEILHFDTIYGGCGKTIDYILEINPGRVSARCIPLLYPCDDDAIVASFKQTVKTARSEGKTPRIALFDVVSSLPGVRFPFEAITAACREEGILSLIDGAQAVGMVSLDLSVVDPDFFVSNCHKWLHVPRGCAVFYVPERNHGMMRSTLPTSHGFVALTAHVQGQKARHNPLPPSGKSAFVTAFEFVGTLDNSPYLCVKDSIEWRRDVLGGEWRIIQYMEQLAREGGQAAARILGTKVLENKDKTLGRCAMVNVALPLAVEEVEDDLKPRDEDLEGVPVVPAGEAQDAFQWILRKLVNDYKTFVALFIYRGRYWARLSAQVFLEMEDFEWAGRTLKDVCERVARGEYKG